jgi:hypothetical protein
MPDRYVSGELADAEHGVLHQVQIKQLFAWQSDGKPIREIPDLLTTCGLETRGMKKPIDVGPSAVEFTPCDACFGNYDDNAM